MIQRLTTLDSSQVGPILAASQREGFRFVARLCEEWASGVNRFEEPGEALFGVFVGSNLVGIGGLNQTKAAARLRRFYILPGYRRQGWGRRLLRHILTHAADHFRCVVLRADTDSANRFTWLAALHGRRIQPMSHTELSWRVPKQCSCT